MHVVARLRLGAQLGAADAPRVHRLVLEWERGPVVPVGALGHAGNARVVVALALVRRAAQIGAPGGRVVVVGPVYRADFPMDKDGSVVTVVLVLGNANPIDQPGVFWVGALVLVLGVAPTHVATAPVHPERGLRAAALVVGHVRVVAVGEHGPARLHKLVLDLLEIGQVARRARLGL